MRLRNLFLVVVMLLGLGGEAFAQADPTFNRLVQEGMQAYRAKDYATAIDKFEAAYSVNPQPELVYNIARANEKSLKRDAAIAAYERFLELPGTTADLRAKALGALEALRKEKAALERVARVEAAPPPAVAGGSPAPGSVTTAPPAKRSRTLEWALIGGGAAVVATGAIFGVLALQANSDFDDLQASGADRMTLEDKQSDAQNNALAADVLIGVGAVSIIAGTIMYLTTGDDDAVAVAPAVGPDFGGVAFSGSF